MYITRRRDQNIAEPHGNYGGENEFEKALFE